ncbi:MAG: M23 family metallopeptidase, partial [Acidobacteria bacterium]|nr:M23 family metallopeptidase [Acidobacteriota bacterium]
PLCQQGDHLPGAVGLLGHEGRPVLPEGDLVRDRGTTVIQEREAPDGLIRCAQTVETVAVAAAQRHDLEPAGALGPPAQDVALTVLASADGTVISAGRKGGFGNLVRVRHPNGYVTGYAHLSRMDVRRGQRVKQGERIGRVGTTGLSTAPHLDYRVQNRSGQYINPQELAALTSDKGVEKEYFNQFVLLRDELMERLASIPEIEPSLSRNSRTD